MTEDALGTPDELRDAVRERYADAARSGRSCCGSDGTGCGTAILDEDERRVFGAGHYEAADREALPESARLASLGCGNPTAVAELREGETVLDLGSGGGIDVLLSAKRVGPSGRAYGLDMTDEMLDLSRANAAQAGVENVEFLEGVIEAIPLTTPPRPSSGRAGRARASAAAGRSGSRSRSGCGCSPSPGRPPRACA